MTTATVTKNEKLTHNVLSEAIKHGVTEFCLAPGARNVPFLHLLKQNPWIKVYYWYEERSAAFFALGRAKKTGKPVAVITTSGTAAAELLPAAMEAYYVSAPLLLITADRPRNFRGTGAPQSAEQKGLFGVYAHFQQDLEGDEAADLSLWTQKGPAHLNVCLEEPSKNAPEETYVLNKPQSECQYELEYDHTGLDLFLESVRHPLVIVSALKEKDRKPVEKFLQKLNAPVFLEGVSGLRECASLQHLRIHRCDHLWKDSAAADYKIDGILRIGGIPTFRLWRDLEQMENQIKVCSISENPFSGLSWGSVLHACPETFFRDYSLRKIFHSSEQWLAADKLYQMRLLDLIRELPLAEQSQLYHLSEAILRDSLVYLGNSLPIREWDLTATNENRGFHVAASRGVNGIDGQISTFLGMSSSSNANVGIFGDLTALYDLAGPWILPQLDAKDIQIVIVNNSGGQIFSRIFNDRSMLNEHNLNFESIAKHWNIDYKRCSSVRGDLDFTGKGIIEIVPDEESTHKFWQGIDKR